MRRYMLVVKATPEFEAGTFPDAAFEAESARYLNELLSAGAHTDAVWLLAIRGDTPPRAGPDGEVSQFVAPEWVCS